MFFRNLCLILLVFASASCVTQQGDPYLSDEMALWRERNSKIHLAMGEKIVSGTSESVVKSALVGFADLNLSVKTVDSQVGFVAAEGVDILPEDIRRPIIEKDIREYHEKYGILYQYAPGHTKTNVTMSLYDYDADSTRVKLRLAHQNIRPAPTATTPKYHELYPDHLQAQYQYIWRHLEKHLFIEENTQ
jgi:hypothetical protein